MPPRPKWTDDELVGFLRSAVLDCGEPLRRMAYRAWAVADAGRPSDDTVMRHLGPWIVALGLAGLDADHGRRRYRI